jgi:hypothetical protein
MHVGENVAGNKAIGLMIGGWLVYDMDMQGMEYISLEYYVLHYSRYEYHRYDRGILMIIVLRSNSFKKLHIMKSFNIKTNPTSIALL